MQLWTKVQLMPGQSRNLTYAFSVAKSPPSWDVADIKPVVGTLMKPYQSFFQAAYGSTPTYCPRASVAWEMATDRKQYDRSTKWYTHTHTYTHTRARGHTLWCSPRAAKCVTRGLINHADAKTWTYHRLEASEFHALLLPAQVQQWQQDV